MVIFLKMLTVVINLLTLILYMYVLSQLPKIPFSGNKQVILSHHSRQTKTE